MIDKMLAPHRAQLLEFVREAIRPTLDQVLASEGKELQADDIDPRILGRRPGL
ncbi:hypothetical protein [Nocardia salmonicida]|uniref:hypothetical protein n=1 Tax=Nocardia salmonicida TaxID=53431 RepID=UPI0037BD48F5